MEVLRRLIIHDGKNLYKQNMIWNMIGSFLFAFASMILTIAVIQIVGDKQGGIYTFAFTFGQQMFMIAYFGIRPFHITDVEHRFTFGDYLHLRIVTCSIAVLIGIGYIWLKGYGYEKAMTVFFMVCYKVIDGFADAYEAEFQRSGRLYLTGKSNAFRTVLSVGCFLSTLCVTEDLVFSCGVAVAAQAAGVFLFDIVILGALKNISWSYDKKRCFKLLQCSSLLFFSVFLDFYIFSAAKYAIEANMGDSSQAVYGAIFMPTSVINLVAGFVIRPYLTDLSLRWEMKEFKPFADIVKRLFWVIFGLTVLAVGGAYFLGIPVLSLLYSNIKDQLGLYRLSLVMIILGGGFNAFLNLFYYMLIIMKQQRMIFCGYSAVCLAALVISPVCVRAGGIAGGSFSYLVLMILLTLCFGISSILIYRKVRGKDGNK